jgi:hypothetical protein
VAATAVATSVRTAKSWATAMRVVLAAMGVIVLVTVSFLVGRGTAGTSGSAVASLIASQPSTATCSVGRPC